MKVLQRVDRRREEAAAACLNEVQPAVGDREVLQMHIWGSASTYTVEQTIISGLHMQRGQEASGQRGGELEEIFAAATIVTRLGV